MSETRSDKPELGDLIAWARDAASATRRRHFTELETGRIKVDDAIRQRRLADGVVAALEAHAAAEAGAPRPVEKRFVAAAPSNAFVHIEFMGVVWQSAVINPALLLEAPGVRNTWAHVISDNMAAVIKKALER